MKNKTKKLTDKERIKKLENTVDETVMNIDLLHAELWKKNMEISLLKERICLNSIQRLNPNVQSMEDRIDNLQYPKPLFRFRLMPMREFLMLCLSVLALAITYKIIVW